MKKDKIRFHFGKSFYIGLLTIVCSLTIVAIAMATFSPKKSAKDPLFIRYDSYYDGSQVQIQTEGNASEITTITMTAAAQENSNNGKIITIESDEELRLFSSKCSLNNSFLGYTYYLISNIEWDSQYTFTPIGTSSNPFIGTFNGQGYEIEGLSLTLNNANYNGGSYYSMFNYVGAAGTITNLGLSHPELKILDAPASFEAGGVSYLVGENNGNVSNSFVVDDKDATKELAGISVSISNSRVSDLVVINNGTLNNCYVVTSRVFNIKQNDLVNQYNQIAISNTGTITNCYFYDDSIKTLTPTDNNKATVTYKVSSKMVDKVNDYFGTYVSSIDNLVTAIDSNWYTKNDYGSYKDYTGIKYGLRRGITLSGSTFTINNEKDFAYMYELFNADDKFASNEITYSITANLNLAKIPVSSYTYKKGIGSAIIGSNIAGTPTMANGSNSSYPTIYNADVMNSSRIAKSTGVDCYGLFNYLTGTVENLNIVPTSMDFSAIETSTNAKGIGVLSGYIEGGHVKNVNVYASITNTTAKDIGEYYIGGITGILGGNGKINGATSAGSITLPNATSTLQASSSYMGGVAIGGIVGYIESSNGAVYTCLNAMNITAKLGSSITYAIGGVIGAGYTMNYDKIVSNGITTVMRTERLENLGTISVCDSTSHTYSELYVAGIIGRHLGELDEVSSFTNRGNITVYANGNTTYVSGVENADIISTAINNTKVEASQFKDGAGNTLFYSSSFANAATVTVEGSSTNLNYTNVSNIKAGNHVKSRISDFYNLAYGYRYEGDDYKAIYKLSTQQISMNLHTTFAPVLNVIGGTSQYTTEARTLYNLRNITFSLSTAISTATTFNYTGCALGEYISYGDIKNEGKMDISLAAGISTTSILKVSGLFETLSNGCTARNLYNGGDITINEPNGSTAEKKIDMYLSGICYQNLSVDSSEKQNPLNANFDSNLAGTMDSIINNGKITVSSSMLDKDEKINQTPETTPHLNSNIYAGGITYTNQGIISTAFNLGKIDISIYSLVSGKYYEAGGISCIMEGQYAQIRDSANNGDIFVIDATNTSYKSVVNIGGIIARNSLQNRNSSAGNNNKQVVAFSINYGTLLAFQSASNMSDTSPSVSNCHSSAAGILGVGICNLIDIVNYGNVYASECAAGIVSLVRLGSFTNDNSNKINLANTINYGQVRINPQYYSIEGVSNNVNQSYNTIVGMEYLEQANLYLKHTFTGSICTVFDFSNQNNINVRFLINLYKSAKTVLFNLNTPTTKPSVDTFITAAGLNDTFGGNSTPIKYAPLTTVEDEYGNIGAFSSRFVFRRAINKDSEIYKPETYITDAYIPKFFQFVVFDKINQSLLQSIGWETIAYQTAAEELVKNVNALATLLDESNVLNAGSGSPQLLREIKESLDDAFLSDTWISSIDEDLFDSLLSISLESSELNTNITDILNYVLFDSTATSSYTNAIRSKIVETILKYYEMQGNSNYYEILQSLLYDVLLAKVVSNEDVNYSAVKLEIESILEDADLTDVFDTYISYLTASGTILTPLFNQESGAYYEDSKIELINTLLNGYDENTLEIIYNSLSSTSISDAIKYKLYLQQSNHHNIAKDIYLSLITYNSLSGNSTYLDLINKIIKKYDFDELIDDELEIDSTLEDIEDKKGNTYSNYFNDISNLSGYKYTKLSGNGGDQTNITTEANNLKTIQAFEGQNVTSLNETPTKDYTALWNIIKNNAEVRNYITDVNNGFFRQFTNYTNGLSDYGIIALATEYNNTYQSNDRSMLSFGIPITYTYGMNTQDSYYGSNKHSLTGAIKYMYLYTPDRVVSYRTNYYGPYENANGDIFTASGYLPNENPAYNLGTALNVTAENGQDFTRSKVPVFVTLDQNLLSEKIAESGTNANSTHYTFHWQDVFDLSNAKADQDFMWKDFTFVYQNPTNVSGMLYYMYDSNGNIMQDENNYIADGYDFSPDYVHTIDKDKTRNNTLPNGQQVHLINETGQAHTYKEYYAVGYASSAMITGIWFNYSCYKPKGIYVDGKQLYSISLNAKLDTSSMYHGYAGIHTTSYIGYTYNDLLKLDGVKTKGKCNNELDEDEINIVSAICQKLLDDNYELVIRAVADYAKEHTFNSGNSNVLNMLLLTVKDVDFASEVIIANVGNIVNLNYDNTKSIKVYLDSLNIILDNYKDKIISISANNRENFRQLLIKLLTEYSIKCKLYDEYNIYIRNALNFFVYKYISYKYSQDNNLDWDDFDNLLSSLSINDSDLTNIRDLFDLDREYLYLDNYEYVEPYTNTVFTINDSTVLSVDYVINSGYDGSVLIGETDFDGINSGSNITFTTGDYSHGYDLYVSYKGNIYLDNYSNSEASLSDIDEAEFLALSPNSTHVLYFDEDTEIYNISIFNSEYISPIFNVSTAVSPFVSYVSITNVLTYNNGATDKFRLVDNLNEEKKYRLYGGIFKEYIKNENASKSDCEAEIEFSLNKGSNIIYNSVHFSFKVLVKQNRDTLTASVKFNNVSLSLTEEIIDYFIIKENNAKTTYDIIQFDGDIAVDDILSNNEFLIDVYYKRAGTSKTSVCVTDILFDYDYDFINGSDNTNKTNVRFHQNVLSPYYDSTTNNDLTGSNGDPYNAKFKNIYRSYMELTNDNSYSFLDISAGNVDFNDIEFPQEDYLCASLSTTYMISSAPTFTPTYQLQSYSQGDVLEVYLDVSDIDISKSLVDNLNAGYYDSLSDVGKYIINNYFIKQQNANNFLTNGESYIEFYATGNGTITIKYEDSTVDVINVSTGEGVYQWFEYITSSNYQYEVSSGVTLDAVFVSPKGTDINYTVNNSVDLLVANSDDILVNFDYSSITTVPSYLNMTNLINQFNEDFEVDYEKYQVFYTVYPYKRYVNGKTNAELYDEDVLKTMVTLIGTIKFDQINPTYYTMFGIDEFINSVYVLSTDTSFELAKTYYSDANGTVASPNNCNLYEFDSGNYELSTDTSFEPTKTYYIDTNGTEATPYKSNLYEFDRNHLVDIIKLISYADYSGTDSALSKLITGLNSSYYVDLLKDLCEDSITKDIIGYNTIIAIYNYASSHRTSDFALYLYATYMGQDYLNSTNLLTNSIMYNLLDVFNDGENGAGYYQFITSNTTVDAQKVTDLIHYLSNSSNINIDGYGIFALSSSQGIGYGIFIPDNLNLSTMDNQYYYDSVNNVLMLGNDNIAYWRGGESINLGAEGSVDYAFYHDMKQLIQSISTDIFELNISNGGTTIKSVDDQIDNDNKVITYYLTTGLGSIYNASSISITNDYKLANGATLSSQTISLTGSNVTKTKGVSVIVKDGVTVYAEDTGVSSKYTLKFIAIDPSGLTLTSDVNSIAYNGGTVTLTLTGNDLPNGLDIEPYIVLTVDGEEYNTADGYWKLDPAFTNNAVVNNGTATIKIIINKSLPGGTDAVNIKIDLANMPSVVLTKVQNTEKNITSFGFVPFGQANQEYNSNVPTSITSTIPYGRAYDYSDLTDPTSNNFYLYKFNVSDNANVQITATKTILESGLMRYVVRYSVTAEAGGTAKVYTHTLNEAQYFAENTQYVSIYADGDEVTRINSEAYNALTANEKPRYLFEGTLNYNIAEDVCIRATFDSHETYYQIKYSVASVDSTTFTTNGNLYVLSNGVYNKVTSGSFSSTVTYYQRDYVVKAVTSASFTTDGSLYKLVDGVYTQIFNGSYDSAVTYYELQYVTASVNSTTFSSNGSLYTRSGSGTTSSPYVYSQVIDKRSNTDDMFASVAFNRTDTSGNNIEPQYRVKYSLANFYTIGDNVEFGTTTSTLGNLATTNITYAGLTVTVSENNDTGTYKFIYTYKNTGVWDNNEVYVRYYEFPEFIVEKQASTDALLHKLTFLEESIVLGNTATVILPTKPLVPDKSGQYYDNTEEIYKTQFESTTRQIVVSASGIKYNDADATSITDYYAIGTVSDADLSYYSPGFEINEYAQIYQYTTLKKLTEYGVGKQTDSDKSILSVHDNMYFYVPYTISNETIVYLVEIDANGYWGNVYTTDFAGNRYSSVTSGSYSEGVTYYSRSGNDYVVTNVTAQTFTTNGSLYVDTLVHTYDASYVNAKNAQVTGGFGDYTVSEFAGSPDKNSSLYMDYTGTPLDGHFWYVSYVVLSEDYLCGGNSRGNVRYYHISIIDATNNVQFEVVFYADTSMNMDDIYLTISETTYKKVNDQKIENGNRQISAYAEETDETYSGSRTDISGFKIYKLKYRLQILPSGYFYFYVDLPDGYVAEARTDKTNNISSADEARYPGAFDPQTSIITVKIQLEIVIKKGTNENSNVWAFNTADKYTRQADYAGTII